MGAWRCSLIEEVLHLVVVHGGGEERRRGRNYVFEPAVMHARRRELELYRRIANRTRGEGWGARGGGAAQAEARREHGGVRGGSGAEDIHERRQREG